MSLASTDGQKFVLVLSLLQLVVEMVCTVLGKLIQVSQQTVFDLEYMHLNHYLN